MSESVWICCACGKQSLDQWGENPINKGWDESCSLNAIQVLTSHIKEVNGQLTILDGGILYSPPPPKPLEDFRTQIKDLFSKEPDPELVKLAEEILKNRKDIK